MMRGKQAKVNGFTATVEGPGTWRKTLALFALLFAKSRFWTLILS
jgi:hypothetical protein